MSANVLDRLNGIGSNRVRKANQKRDEISLTRKDLATFDEFVSANEIAETFFQRRAIALQSLTSSLYKKFVNLAWDNKFRPKNPRIQTYRDDNKPNNSAIFQVKSRFDGLNKFIDEDDPETAIVEALSSEGGVYALPRATAESLVKTELVTTQTISVRSLTELTVGRKENGVFVKPNRKEQSAAEKLIMMLTTEPDKNGFIKVKGLTAEERDILIMRENNVQVKDASAFWRRIFDYAQSKFQFMRILEVFKPATVFSHALFAQSDTEKERDARLAEYVTGVLRIDD